MLRGSPSFRNEHFDVSFLVLLPCGATPLIAMLAFTFLSAAMRWRVRLKTIIQMMKNMAVNGVFCDTMKETVEHNKNVFISSYRTALNEPEPDYFF